MNDKATLPLNQKERKELERLEAAITASFETWLPRASALASIQHAGLFRERYESFDDYVETRWDVKRRQAYHLIGSSKTATMLETAGLPLPVAERHVRPLSKLKAADAVEVWTAVIKTAGGDPARVTGDVAAEAVKNLKASRGEDARASGGRLVLSAEAKAAIEAAKKAVLAPQDDEEGPGYETDPLVAIPPPMYGYEAGGPVLVPASYLDGPLDEAMIKTIKERFAEHYAAAGKKGPQMNLTNEHVGWALWTLNLTTGCTWTCPFCYAREIAELRYPQGFAPTVHPERLLAPANTVIPAKYAGQPAARRVFLGSQTDWMDGSFHDEVVKAVIKMCKDNPDWEFMTLTKQPQRLKDFTFPRNMWIGVTVTRQGQVAAAEEALAQVDAAVRWISFEPLHGSVVLARPELVDLYVIGAERKTRQRPKVKPTRADWVDALRLQARSVKSAIWEKENLHVWLREMPEPRRTPITSHGPGMPQGTTSDLEVGGTEQR